MPAKPYSERRRSRHPAKLVRDVGQRIRQLRVDDRMDAKALADRIGVEPSAVSQWERGAVIPRAEHLIAVADVFDVSTDYILKGTHKDGRDADRDNYQPVEWWRVDGSD